MRVDLYLSENGFARSRTEAKVLIGEGAVFMNGTLVTKPSLDVPAGASIEVKRTKTAYVSRGGYKLEAALDAFALDPKGSLAVDIGASSGGFTDCLLQRGASCVIAVDSGTMQLSSLLRDDERVTVMENTNARYLSPDMLKYVPNFAVMDVSFISATYLIQNIYDILEAGADFICLIKPQFEVGKAHLGKHGVVKDEKSRRAAKEKVLSFAESVGFSCVGVIQSPIFGGDGNIEYLAHFKK